MKDFIIYYPLKVNNEYECTPYSFLGTLTSFSDSKDLFNFLKSSFYTEEDCNVWIKNQKIKNHNK